MTTAVITGAELQAIRRLLAEDNIEKAREVFSDAVAPDRKSVRRELSMCIHTSVHVIAEQGHIVSCIQYEVYSHITSIHWPFPPTATRGARGAAPKRIEETNRSKSNGESRGADAESNPKQF